MGDLVLCTVEDGLARLTLNRPEKLNALSIAAFREIAAHLDALDSDKVGCVLLTRRRPQLLRRPRSRRSCRRHRRAGGRAGSRPV